MEKFNIGIIGYGFVGEAVYHLFKDNNVKIYDKFKEHNTIEETVTESDYIFLCVPTPFNSHEFAIDLSYITDVMDRIKDIAKGKIVIIKSTVVPTTTECLTDAYPDIDFVMNPEFLTEKNHIEDFKNTKRIVIGNSKKKVFKKMEKLYRSFFDDDIPILDVSPTEAEIIKYEANVILATKVAVANVFYDVCQKTGSNYEKVRGGVEIDPRIGSHISVTEERGFGGKCFYKDLGALIGFCNSNNIDCEHLKEVHNYNLRIRKNHDWEDIPGASDKSKDFKNQ